MATRMLRRGLPRVPGGEPWPPGGLASPAGADDATDADAVTLAAANVADDARADAAADAAAPVDAAPVGLPDVPPAAPTVESSPESGAPGRVTEEAGAATVLRRGLPRVPGGEPWPPSDARPVQQSASAEEPTPATAPAPAAPAVSPAAATSVAAARLDQTNESTPAASAGGAGAPSAAAGAAVRRGLPRVAGGESWPPAGTVPIAASASTAEAARADTAAEAAPAETALGATALPDTAVAASVADVTAATSPAAPAASTAVAPARTAFALGDPSVPLPAPRTVWNGSAPRHITTSAPASGRLRPSWTQAIAALLGAASLGILAAAAVAFVRALLSFPFMQDFLAAFPGEYTPAVSVEPGFAPWIGWQHFFNVFLMVLIIRSGLRIRNEKRPTAFWTPRGNPKGKVSLTIWFHQALDVLWLVNGVIFVVLLFVTGHWVRIVPTSWEVIPNALSAALQYVSFDWPTEHGWVNYNSLQQLAYFVTVFIAAPLAAVTGVRMSGVWPKKAERLSKAYPIEWARAVHFPVMIYFVVFIIGHVALVFLTGFLRNLNHMYASSDAVGWTGFWVFLASLVVIALGWVAARPLVIAPIAKLFGTVSGR